MNTLGYRIPLVLIGIHACVIIILALTGPFPHPDVPEFVTWEYPQSLVDFPLYRLLELPRPFAAASFPCVVYALLVGTVQWGMIGLVIRSLRGWQLKDERHAASIRVALWITPVWPVIFFLIHYLFAGDSVGVDDGWWNVAAAFFPALAAIASIVMERAFLRSYCVTIAIMSYIFLLNNPWW